MVARKRRKGRFVLALAAEACGGGVIKRKKREKGGRKFFIKLVVDDRTKLRKYR